MTPQPRQCKFCDTDCLPGKDFCSDKCFYEHKLMLLQNANVELKDKLSLLNSERTGYSINPDLSFDGNVQESRFEEQKRVDQMTPDILYLHQAKMFAMLEVCHLASTRLGIKDQTKKKYDSKIQEAQSLREKQSLPRQKDLKDKELWLRSWVQANQQLLTGKTDQESKQMAEGAWKQSQLREKAIEGFLKIPGFDRAKAEAMIQQMEGSKPQ